MISGHLLSSLRLYQASFAPEHPDLEEAVREQLEVVEIHACSARRMPSGLLKANRSEIASTWPLEVIAAIPDHRSRM